MRWGAWTLKDRKLFSIGQKTLKAALQNLLAKRQFEL